jgi:leucyl-tRNA synthetase
MFLITWPQEMTKEGAGLRTGPKDSYHDKVFEEEINNLINITKEQYELYATSLLTYRYSPAD